MHPKNEQWSGDALTLASRVNHDLRSPMGAVETTCEILRELLQAVDSDEAHITLLKNIENSAADALGLLQRVSAVLRASYGGMPSREKVDSHLVADIASTRLGSLARQRETTVSVTGTWPEIDIVEDWLAQILSLLLDNAIRHGGKQVVLDAAEIGGDLQIRVDDNGPGFPDCRLDEPFPRFEQLHELSGLSGLGLAMARRYADLLGGSLDYERLPNGVTRVSFSLPLHPDID